MIAGSTRNCGGVVGSDATAGSDIELHDLAGRVGIGRVEVVTRLAAAEGLVGPDVAEDVVAHAGRW